MTSYSIRTSFDVPREIGVVKKLRVLVVEDDGVVAMLVEDMLIELGHEVTAVVSRIEEALQLAKTGSFDFAILDLNLGGKPSNAVAELLESPRHSIRDRHRLWRAGTRSKIRKGAHPIETIRR